MVFQVLRRRNENGWGRTAVLHDGKHSASRELLTIEMRVHATGLQDILDATAEPTALVGTWRDDKRSSATRRARIEGCSDEDRRATAARMSGKKKIEAVPPIALFEVLLNAPRKFQ